MVAGNHDTPRAAETGCILRLFAPLGIHVVDCKAGAFRSRSGVSRSSRCPMRGAGRTSTAGCRGTLQRAADARRGRGRDPAAAANRFDGDHQGEIWASSVGVTSRSAITTCIPQIAPNAFYSGSLDYTSANPWGELVEERTAGVAGKGFIEYDLDTRRHRFHPIAPPRLLVDLPALSARGLTASDVDAQIAGAVDRRDGGIDGKIVRLVVRDIPRHIVRELDHRLLREYRRRALHFQLDYVARK